MTNSIKEYGLIGYPLSHSFSPGYFRAKFEREGLPHCRYDAYPLPSLGLLPKLLDEHPALAGLNVTIPYKTSVMEYLHEVSAEAAEIGAVNVININNGRLVGHNSDAYGFEVSLRQLLPRPLPKGLKALVLGTGGAAKAVVFTLKKMGIGFQLVSRHFSPETLDYESITADVLQSHQLIVNTTPLGMMPDLNACPPIPYEHATDRHYFYDLVYNPSKTRFLELAEKAGSHIGNGLSMLHLQAERAWAIWNGQVDEEPENHTNH